MNRVSRAKDKAVRGSRGADPELVQIAPQVTSGGKPQAASSPHLHDDGSPVLVRELGQEVGDRAVARCSFVEPPSVCVQAHRAPTHPPRGSAHPCPSTEHMLPLFGGHADRKQTTLGPSIRSRSAWAWISAWHVFCSALSAVLPGGRSCVAINAADADWKRTMNPAQQLVEEKKSDGNQD